MVSYATHWKALGCLRGVLIHASHNGRRVYERLGFRPSNALAIDLAEAPEAAAAAGGSSTAFGASSGRGLGSGILAEWTARCGVPRPKISSGAVWFRASARSGSVSDSPSAAVTIAAPADI